MSELLAILFGVICLYLGFDKFKKKIVPQPKKVEGQIRNEAQSVINPKPIPDLVAEANKRYGRTSDSASKK